MTTRKPCCMGSDWKYVWQCHWHAAPCSSTLSLGSSGAPPAKSCFQQPPWLQSSFLIQTSNMTFSYGANSFFPSIQLFFLTGIQSLILRRKDLYRDLTNLSKREFLAKASIESELFSKIQLKKIIFQSTVSTLCLSSEKHWVFFFPWPEHKLEKSNIESSGGSGGQGPRSVVCKPSNKVISS